VATGVLIPTEVAPGRARIGAVVAPPISYALSYPVGFTGLVHIRVRRS
jgi:hypothetical protein